MRFYMLTTSKHSFYFVFFHFVRKIIIFLEGICVVRVRVRIYFDAYHKILSRFCFCVNGDTISFFWGCNGWREWRFWDLDVSSSLCMNIKSRWSWIPKILIDQAWILWVAHENDEDCSCMLQREMIWTSGLDMVFIQVWTPVLQPVGMEIGHDWCGLETFCRVFTTVEFALRFETRTTHSKTYWNTWK